MATRARAKAGPIERIPAGAIICRFAVEGRAIPWKPARVTSRGTYKPRVVRDWQALVALRARLAMGRREPYAGPVRAAIRIGHTSNIVGDWDNLAKSIIDATQLICIVNDRQIRRAEVEKILGDEDGAEVTYYAI